MPTYRLLQADFKTFASITFRVLVTAWEEKLVAMPTMTWSALTRATVGWQRSTLTVDAWVKTTRKQKHKMAAVGAASDLTT